MAKTVKVEAAFDGTPKLPLSGAMARVLAASAGVLVSWRKVRQHRRAVAELQQLDDRMLKDIGIDRSNIPRAARHGREYI